MSTLKFPYRQLGQLEITIRCTQTGQEPSISFSFNSLIETLIDTDSETQQVCCRRCELFSKLALNLENGLDGNGRYMKIVTKQADQEEPHNGNGFPQPAVGAEQDAVSYDSPESAISGQRDNEGSEVSENDQQLVSVRLNNSQYQPAAVTEAQETSTTALVNGSNVSDLHSLSTFPVDCSYSSLSNDMPWNTGICDFSSHESSPGSSLDDLSSASNYSQNLLPLLSPSFTSLSQFYSCSDSVSSGELVSTLSSSSCSQPSIKRDSPPALSTFQFIGIGHNTEAPMLSPSYAQFASRNEAPLVLSPCASPPKLLEFSSASPPSSGPGALNKRQRSTSYSSQSASPSDSADHPKTKMRQMARSFKCSFSPCKADFSRRHDLLRHEYNVHGKQQEWMCHSCKRCFSKKASLEKHNCPTLRGAAGDGRDVFRMTMVDDRRGNSM